jgi:hypothetical protein
MCTCVCACVYVKPEQITQAKAIRIRGQGNSKIELVSSFPDLSTSLHESATSLHYARTI